MRRTPNRIRITPSFHHIFGIYSRDDEAMAAGARTSEALYLARIRENGWMTFENAKQLESMKRLAKSLTGSHRPHMLCGHEV